MNDAERQRLIVAQVAVKAAVELHTACRAPHPNLAETARQINAMVYAIAEPDPGPDPRTDLLADLAALTDRLEDRVGWAVWKDSHPRWQSTPDTIRDAIVFVMAEPSLTDLVADPSPNDGDDPPTAAVCSAAPVAVGEPNDA